MPVDLQIGLAPERLNEGSPEERAAFGLLSVRNQDNFLTEGIDFFINGYRTGPLVSGYHAAEWLAWNWWRLRWEPRSAAVDWLDAHRMTSIGEGYVWPNITIFSDGLRTALISRPSVRPDAKPFRYLGAPPVVVPSTAFESAVDAFERQVLGRLHAEGVAASNLERLWADILEERGDPEVAERRRLEALLGRDPDSVEDDVIDGLLADAERLGEGALDELAANRAQFRSGNGAPMTAADLDDLAESRGHEASPHTVVRLDVGTRLPHGADVPAWQVGVAAARELRRQQHLGNEPIGNARLAEMAGASQEALLEPSAGGINLSFALDKSAKASRIVLRSKWSTGRRFDLARLIGDRLMAGYGALHPATRSYTYRQKTQRAFAAELLSPFVEVEAMMDGDYSEERQQEVAERFDVSPKTIETLLMNHGRLERLEPQQDFDVVAA